MLATEAVNELVAKAAEDPSVLAVLMFGSVARNEQGPASDVDICLVLQPGTSEEMSQKRLDYLALCRSGYTGLSAASPVCAPTGAQRGDRPALEGR